MGMSRDEWRELTNSDDGKALRAFFGQGVNSTPPRKSDIAAALDEMGVEDKSTRAKLTDQLTDLAERTRAGESDVLLTQVANEAALGWLKKRRADDHLFGDDGLSSGPTEAESDDAAWQVEQRGRGLSDEQIARERADAAERDRLGKLGVKVT